MNEALMLIALTIYHEGRGEPFAGKVAIAHVIMNRSEQRGKPVRDIVFQPDQFSCFNNGIKPIDDFDSFIICVSAVREARRDRLYGRTLKGANHYHRTDIDTKWDDNMVVVAEIGNHRFYKN